MTRAAVWLRVSTGHQTSGNQVPDVERFAEHHGYEIATTYRVSESAWNGGKDGGEYKRALDAALGAAHCGEFSVLIVWALDRLTRGGAEDTLRLLRRFRQAGCTVVSVQESWLNGSPEVQDVLVAFAGWLAQQESARRSARIKAGIARRKQAGLPVGRAQGSKDRKPRKRSGYVERWEKQRAQQHPDPKETP